MELNPGQLEALVAIADHGSFDAAARQLHVTPSAVSQRIRALEGATGQVLISRGTPCRPTPPGEWLVRLGRQTRLLYDEASQALTEAGGVELPVAVNADSLTVWFHEVLAEVARWDGVALRLHVEDETHSAELLRSGEVLAAVTSDPAPVQGCSARPLGALRYLPAAAPWFAARWRRGGAADAGEPDWAAMPTVVFGAKDDLQYRMLRRRGVGQPPPVVHQVPAPADFYQAVLIGLGWGMLPQPQAEADLAAGRLTLLAPDVIDAPLYWQRWRLDSPRLTALTAAVQTAAERNLTRGGIVGLDKRRELRGTGTVIDTGRVTERRSARAATLRVGLLGSCLAALAIAITACAPGPSVSAGGSAGGSADPQAAAQPARHPHHPGHQPPGVSMLAVRDAFSACEQRMETSGGDIPTMAIVGASYTAGVGPDNPSLSWAADLARNLRWDAVIYGDPGAGYTRPGDGAFGPMTSLLSAERLPSLNPSLVILQAGYDDGRVPPAVERQQVIRTIEQIQAQAPNAQIGLVTVFTPPGPAPTRFYRTDDTIIAAARSVDPNAIIMDPLAGHWTYQHADHNLGLHPTAAGDAWIAQKVGSMLHRRGIDPRPRTSGAAPVTCDLRTLATRTVATRA